MISVSLVIPAYNEEATLSEVAQRCLRVLAECASDHELVMLDDASTDRTVEVMERIREQDPQRIRILRHHVNRGIAVSFEELYAAATKDAVFLIPGDGQYPPEALRACVPLLADYDIVVCNRRSKRYTLYRHVVSAGYRLLPLVLFGVRLYDPGSVKLVRREIIAGVHVRSKGVFVEAERLIRAARRGYRIGKVDIEHQVRTGGKARGASFPLVWESLRDVFSLWVQLVVLRRPA